MAGVDLGMDFTQAEAESLDQARRQVAEMLDKPEKLERLEHFKRKVARKKATVESLLRSAVQTQLDGVETGLHNLRKAEGVVEEVKESMDEVETLYKGCMELEEVVRPIKDVNRRHQQLKITTTHINNIFSVPKVVETTYVLIKEEKLLEAHRNLSELEHTRDELLMQLYQSEDAYVDKNTSLHHYFEQLIGLSDALGQQLWLVLNDTCNLVVHEPRRVVTAVRIIQREEQADKLVQKTLTEKGIPRRQLPGRPKNWRAKCFQILEGSISNKFGEITPQDRVESKAWLGDHLSAVAGICYQDLQAMNTHGHKCFPPDYGIIAFFIKHYHGNLVRVISELVHGGLNARDIITLMVWVGDIRESFQESLGIDLKKYGPLVEPTIEKELQDTCHKQVGANVKELMLKMLEAEKEDWYSSTPPDADVNGSFYTTLGITLFQMIDQNISALAPLGVGTKTKVLRICLEQIMEFLTCYRESIDAYVKKHHQSGRREPPCFIFYMIALANNCRASIDFLDQLKTRFSMEVEARTLDADIERSFKGIREEFDSIGHHCCDMLILEVFSDLKPVLDGLMTKDAWFGAPLDLIGKVEGTLLDYNGDFIHLKQAYHNYLIVEAQHRVLHEYMQALFARRMVFKKDKDRDKAGKIIQDEAKKLSAMFLRLSHATNPKYIQVVEILAEILRCKVEYLPLEISSLAMKHPDITGNHIVAVMAMRGDLNKSTALKLMQQTTVAMSEQTDGGASGAGSARGGVARGGTSLSRRKADEKSLFESLHIPNPYSLFGKSKD